MFQVLRAKVTKPFLGDLVFIWLNDGLAPGLCLRVLKSNSVSSTHASVFLAFLDIHASSSESVQSFFSSLR